MHQRSLLATGTWVAIGLTTWTIAWVIAESIPVFNDLLSLIVRLHSDSDSGCSLTFLRRALSLVAGSAVRFHNLSAHRIT